MTRHSCKTSVSVFALLGCLVAVSAAAQSGTSGVRGTVSDQLGAHVPGATITLANPATGFSRTTVTDASGDYQFVAIPPGTYRVTVELQGFRTAVYDSVALPVDTVARQDLSLSVGALSESVQVVAEARGINTTDASLGNTIGENQVRSLPLEARNVVGLLSLQPGAVYLPNTGTFDPRSGSVSGARADQSNVTLDGVDVNDPQFGTAYNSALRVTLDALQEFRVSTSNFGADTGRSSSAQVSLVTKSGTNAYRGSGYWVQRDTAFSSNEYFLKLSQLAAGDENKTPKLDKKIGGGAFGGPIKHDKLFFFGNFEGLKENSESPVLRNVPSETFRDGILVYQCADQGACPATSVTGFSATHAIPAGYHGASPAELTAIDPLRIGPSRAVSELLNKYPTPNDPGIDGYNLVGFRFASPIENQFKTFIGRLDYTATVNQNLFGRFNLQDDAVASVSQFPGQAPNQTQKIRSRGFAVGHNWVLASNKTNTFRYGFTEIREDNIGLHTENRVSLRFIDDYEATVSDDTTFPASITSGRTTPTHNLVNDFNWIKGRHTIKTGANLRFSRIPRYSNLTSFNSSVANGSWTTGVGVRYAPGLGPCEGSEAGCAAVPAIDEGFAATWADSFIPLLGVLSETTLQANYDRDGNVLPVGEPVRRKYGSDEYEFYVQDSWQVSDSLSLTGGLRYGLYSPPWEVNGLQVAPDINLGTLFETRRSNMLSGIPDNQLSLIAFDLAGPANGKPGFYEWDKNNFAPRVAFAWNPTGSGGLARWLTGDHRLVVRGGYSVVYDRIGQALATQYDNAGSFGLSTNLSSPYGQYGEDSPLIRYTAVNVLPSTLPEAPPGGFPQTPPVEAGVITSALDSSIRTPYAHSFNLVVGRELSQDFSIEAAYVGRLGRNLLVRRDLMMPLDLVDPASGVDYYTAVGALITAAQANGIENVGPIPYWENLFPDAATDGLSATQAMATTFLDYGPDWISALYGADQYCEPACSVYGPFAFFNRQYDSLGAQSSIGRSEYNSLQLSLRKRWSKGYQFDFNYTLAHAKDNGSAVERGSAFTEVDNGGYTGFLIDTWNPDKQWGNADFDVRHQVNANWIVDLPFGRDRALGRNTGGLVNAIVGDWALAGLWRWTSGFPLTVQNCRSCWATNWNLQGNAELAVPGRLPATGTTRNAVNGLPSPFLNPAEAVTYFRRALPGETGLRNVIRGDGYFSIDASLSKGWTMPWSSNQRLRFRWDVFNLTNTPRFDTFNVTMVPDRVSTFGSYNGTLATCDGGAGRCMQWALRYEF